MKILNSVCLMEADLKNRLLIAKSIPESMLYDSNVVPKRQFPLFYASAHFCFQLAYIVEVLASIGVTESKQNHFVEFIDFDDRLNFNTTHAKDRYHEIHQESRTLENKEAFDFQPPLTPKSKNNEEELKESFQRPFEKPIGMILRHIFSDDLLKNIFILGASHWKNKAFISPIDEAVKKWLQDHPNRTDSPTALQEN